MTALSGGEADWQVTCPVCSTGIGGLAPGPASMACARCGAVYRCEGGIWRLLPPARAAAFQEFLRDYTRIRQEEGRWSEDPAYYEALPDVPAKDPLVWQWSIRSRTFRHLLRRVLPALGEGLRVLDLGAGTGWLSNRLARSGHRPLAVELSLDERDGLAAARHFQPGWPRIHAEFDHLPLASGQADLAVFNASFHYSTDYRLTLSEALRVLKPAGRVAVLDSPIYRRLESGRQMVAEKRADFERRYGTRSEALPSQEYLTWDGLLELERELELRFRVFRPWYGWSWALRPWKAWWRGGREPSRFAILLGERAR